VAGAAPLAKRLWESTSGNMACAVTWASTLTAQALPARNGDSQLVLPPRPRRPRLQLGQPRPQRVLRLRVPMLPTLTGEQKPSSARARLSSRRVWIRMENVESGNGCIWTTSTAMPLTAEIMGLVTTSLSARMTSMTSSAASATCTKINSAREEQRCSPNARRPKSSFLVPVKLKMDVLMAEPSG